MPCLYHSLVRYALHVLPLMHIRTFDVQNHFVRISFIHHAIMVNYGFFVNYKTRKIHLRALNMEPTFAQSCMFWKPYLYTGRYRERVSKGAVGGYQLTRDVAICLVQINPVFVRTLSGLDNTLRQCRKNSGLMRTELRSRNMTYGLS